MLMRPFLPAPDSLLHMLESYGPDQFAAALVGDSGTVQRGKLCAAANAFVRCYSAHAELERCGSAGSG